MNPGDAKKIQTKMMKNLLDLVILQYVDSQPTHGYEIITKIKKQFGVYFGPSTIYPVLNALEKHGFLKSKWNQDTARPRKVYELTDDGKNILKFGTNYLADMYGKIQKMRTGEEVPVEMLISPGREQVVIKK